MALEEIAEATGSEMGTLARVAIARLLANYPNINKNLQAAGQLLSDIALLSKGGVTPYVRVSASPLAKKWGLTIEPES